jgi:hypothetical protein
MNPRRRLLLKTRARKKAAQAEISLPTEVDLITEEESVEVKPAIAPRVAVTETDASKPKQKTKKTTKTTSKGG